MPLIGFAVMTRVCRLDRCACPPRHFEARRVLAEACGFGSSDHIAGLLGWHSLSLRPWRVGSARRANALILALGPQNPCAEHGYGVLPLRPESGRNCCGPPDRPRLPAPGPKPPPPRTAGHRPASTRQSRASPSHRRTEHRKPAARSPEECIAPLPSDRRLDAIRAGPGDVNLGLELEDMELAARVPRLEAALVRILLEVVGDHLRHGDGFAPAVTFTPSRDTATFWVQRVWQWQLNSALPGAAWRRLPPRLPRVLTPACIDHDPRAHWRRPMEMMRHG